MSFLPFLRRERREKKEMQGRFRCLLMGLLLLGACDAPASHEESTKHPEPAEPVVQTARLESASITTRVDGYATILNPDTLIQADADLRTAKIAVDYSNAILGRSQSLFKNSVVVSRQALETAQRQADADAVQVKLLETRLRAVWGDGAPFLSPEPRTDIVRDLSSGRKSLLRADFAGEDPGSVVNARLTPLGGGAGTPINLIWAAPSGNLAMPGASFFGIVDSRPGLRAGDRAHVVAQVGPAKVGVVIPHAAIVIQSGSAWCFIESEKGRYVRKAVSLEQPVDAGYIAGDGFEPGANVVVRGAAMLLAREAASPEESAERRAP
jgi:hypothetical protein